MCHMLNRDNPPPVSDRISRVGLPAAPKKTLESRSFALGRVRAIGLIARHIAEVVGVRS